MTPVAEGRCPMAAAGAARWLQVVALAGWLALAGGCATQPPSASSSGAVTQNEPLPESSEEPDERRRARIRLELAAGYYQQRNFNVALDEVRQSMAIDPNYAPAYGLLGVIYMDLGDRNRAEENFQRALKISPADSEILNNYGWFLCQTDRPRESIDYFQRALRNRLYATPAKPLANAGICSLRAGNEQAAEEFLQRAFQLAPTDPVAMYNLGELFLKRHDVERARFHSQRLLSLYEPTAQTLWLALRTERMAGNRDAELSLAAQLRRRFPQSREASLLQSGRYE